MIGILSTWTERLWQDLEPTPGRMNSALRIVLASVITLLLLMTLRMPFAGLGMYFVFLIGRDSPAVSFRSSIFIDPYAGGRLSARCWGSSFLRTTIPWRACSSVAVVTFLPG